MMEFHFKQFTIKQDQCAMKVGTDGVLLGAWAPLDNEPQNILDIGTGTGLLALMLAQRTNAQEIEALEIDGEAYEQAAENFENSPWNNRLYVYHAGLDEFVEEVAQVYDYIICNPPFYSEDYKTGNEKRNLARFEDALPFEELIEAADLFLSDNGIFSVIIPYKEEERFVLICQESNLFPLKITRVKGTPTSEIKRSLLAFSRYQQTTIITDLIIETSRHQYTPEYISFTKDFYINF
jgi:tRNA1Val (adenine37-N6)-methyltransferase